MNPEILYLSILILIYIVSLISGGLSKSVGETSQHTGLISSHAIVDLWACCHNSMSLHLILETTKTAETSFF